MRFVIGIDLGTINDFTSVAVVEMLGTRTAGNRAVTGVIGRINIGPRRVASRRPYVPLSEASRNTAQLKADMAAGTHREKKPEPEPLAEYRLRHLDRYLGEPYTKIVEKIQEMLERPELTGSKIIVDATGVGRPVVDLMAERGLKSLVPVVITGGDSVTEDYVGGRREYRVPKRDLVGTLQVLLENRRLRIPTSLNLRSELVREMQNFKIKLNAETGHASYEHWRSSDHDDLVLALAMACWYAENH